jgi:hypothetical protein
MQLNRESKLTMKNLLFKTFGGNIISADRYLRECILEQHRLDWPRMTEQEIRREKARKVAEERQDIRQASFALVILSGQQRRADLKAATVLLRLRYESAKALLERNKRLMAFQQSIEAQKAAAEKEEKDAKTKPKKKAKITEPEPESEDENPRPKKRAKTAKSESLEPAPKRKVGRPRKNVKIVEPEPESSEPEISEPESPEPAPKRKPPARPRGRPRKVKIVQPEPESEPESQEEAPTLKTPVRRSGRTRKVRLP